MQVYHDQDVDLNLLEGRRIAVIGYGNQGRAQALNLRDSGLEVLIDNREDDYAGRARKDGFSVTFEWRPDRGCAARFYCPRRQRSGIARV